MNIRQALDELSTACSDVDTSIEQVNILKQSIITAFEGEDRWISVSDLPEREIPVIGVFPNGDESGRKVAGAIRYGNQIHSDAPTSTAHCFVPTLWMYYPTAPDTKEANLSLIHGTIVPDAILTVSGSEEEKVIKGFTIGGIKTYSIDEIKGRKIAVRCETEVESLAFEKLARVDFPVSGYASWGNNLSYRYADNVGWSYNHVDVHIYQGYQIIDSKQIK